MRKHLVGLALFLFAVGGCGPSYPNCENDDHCKEHGEYCVNKLCKQCRDDSHCDGNDKCQVCGSMGSCERRYGCCLSDLDCPGGRCWLEANTTVGTCGGRCKADDHCPQGQKCVGGNCVPKGECETDAQCPQGKRCENNYCVSACEGQAIYFDFNESVLRADQRGTMDNNLSCVKVRNQMVTIEGNCDERGTEEYNLALGMRRATTAQKYLTNGGVSSSMIKTISYGEERPVCSEASDSCWDRNRRDEFRFQ